MLVASIYGHTKTRDHTQNSLYKQDFDAVQSLNRRKPSQYIILEPKGIRGHKKCLLEVIRKTSQG